MGSGGRCLLLICLALHISRKHLHQEHQCMPWVATGLYQLPCPTTSSSARHGSAGMLQQRWGCGGNHRQPAPRLTSEGRSQALQLHHCSRRSMKRCQKGSKSGLAHVCACVRGFTTPPSPPHQPHQFSSKKSRTVEHRPKATRPMY